MTGVEPASGLVDRLQALSSINKPVKIANDRIFIAEG
jgi:hypothetical protein